MGTVSCPRVVVGMGVFFHHRRNVRCVYSFEGWIESICHRFTENNNVAFVGLAVLTRIDTCVPCACKVNAYLIKQSKFVGIRFAYDFSVGTYAVVIRFGFVVRVIFSVPFIFFRFSLCNFIADLIRFHFFLFTLKFSLYNFLVASINKTNKLPDSMWKFKLKTRQ